MGRFNQVASVFRNEDALREEYEPNQILERDAEETEFLNTLSSVTNGSRPSNIFVYGQTGLGKTLATRMMLRELKEDVSEMDELSLSVIWENCHDNTSYQTAVGLVNQLREENGDGDAQINGTGYSTSDVHDMLWDGVRASDNTHIIFVLDEVDGIAGDGDNKLLYQIGRANAERDLGDTKVSMVGISNNFTFRDALSSRVRECLCESEIHFSPYDAHQLRSIIEQRTDEAFNEGVVSNAAIAKIAAKTAQDTGSARHAIDMLHEAGLLARKAGAESIGDDLVDQAATAVQRGRIMDELRSLTQQSHYVLWAIINLEKEGTAPASTSEIYTKYRTIANSYNSTVQSKRTIHNRLSDLSLSGFLSFRQVNKGKGGGMYNTYTLEMPTDAVESVLREESDLWERSEQSELI